MARSSQLTVAEADRRRLEQLVRGGNTPQKLVKRATIVLLSTDGIGMQEIARQAGVTKPTVSRWRRFYREGGVERLLRDAPRPGRKPRIGEEVVKRVVEITLHEKPSQATHWSTRSLAPLVGISAESVRRIWKAHGLKPHLIRSFKLSRDPRFLEKLQDVVGLYLNPPEKALVFSVDEKSQVQALDRTQPGLPMKRGRAGTMTHDYKRNGTTTLFAALNVLEGTVLRECMKRHRHEEFLRFLKKLERETPPDLDLHLIVDNYATHKHSAVAEWLTEHPRVHLHFTPTSASWLNLVERFFAEITNKRLRRGSFQSVNELEAAIHAYIDDWNRNPKPFVWTASVKSIVDKVGRGNEVLAALH